MEQKTPYEKFQEMIELLLSIDTTRLISVDYMTKEYQGESGKYIAIYPEIKIYTITDNDKFIYHRLVENEKLRLKFMEEDVKKQKEIIRKLKKEWVLGGVETEEDFKEETKKYEGIRKEYKKGIWRKDKK